MGEPSGVEFQRVHPGLLKEIIVRPILPGERWEELMCRHHYLGFSRRVGESRCGRARRRVVRPAWLACGGPQVPASRPFYRLAPAPAVSAPSDCRKERGIRHAYRTVLTIALAALRGQKLYRCEGVCRFAHPGPAQGALRAL